MSNPEIPVGHHSEAQESDKSSANGHDVEMVGTSTAPSTMPAAVSAQPPNGGLVAWLQVLGAFCHWFSVWGIILSFGIFQEYYQTTYLSNYSPSDISWIGTIQAFLVFFLGLFAGPLFDRGCMRTLVIVGTFLTTLGLMTASVARQYYSIFLSLGLCTGLGMSCMWISSVSNVGTYFTTKRPLAGSLAATGAGFGNVVFSAAFKPMVSAIGFGWAMRLIAFIDLAFMLLGLAVLKQRPTPQRPRKLVDWSAFREPKYNFFFVAMFFLLAAAYVPFYYLAVFATEKLGVSEGLSYSLISVMGAGSIFGRAILGFAALKYGVFQVLGTGTLIVGMLAFIWGSVSNIGGVVCFALFYGAMSGGVAGLQPTAVQHLAPIHLIGTRSGMILVPCAVGVLVGNPIAGAILNTNAQFTGVQVFAGAFMLFGTVMVFLTLQAVHKHEKRQEAQ